MMVKNKSSKQGNIFQKNIVEFLKKNRGSSYKKKELSRAMGIKKSTYHQFREALNELNRSGKIVRLKGGRYTIAAVLQKIKGQLQMTRKGFAFVTDERTGEDIFVAAQNLNTALDQDMVEVQLFGVSSGKNKEGQVINIISRSQVNFVGTYHHSEYYGFVVPDNPRVYRDFYIPDQKTLNAKNGQKVLVELVKWDSSQLNPEGQIIEVLGFPDEPGVDVASVAMSFGLPLSFSRRLESKAAGIQFTVSGKELAQRMDIRDKIVFTIDPVDAKDFDDAVSLETTGNGHYELGVHIADVSHFVTEDSDIDREALRRATSVYLVDRVIPMLPEHLSNHICSLKPHEDRLTYSCIMEITPEGRVVDYQIRKSIINSKRRFTYEEVQAIIDDPDSSDRLAPHIKRMHHLSRVLRERRFKKGSIDFDTPEVRFKLDKAGKPIEIIPLKRLHSHEMIEEFMLMANQTVSRHITRISGGQRPHPFIYRVHEKPEPEKLQKFKEFLQALGYNISIKRNLTSREFQEILARIEGSKDEVLVREVALRTMMKATYSTRNVGHFGLAFEDYTHFTSPIRRYPDLAVHRLLKEYRQPVALKRKQGLKTRLKRVCQVASERERIALEAERESVRIKQVEWIAGNKGQIYEGLISGVTSFGIFVETVPYLIEGLVRIEDLEDDFYIYDEKTYSLIGRNFGRLLRLGDSVKVKVSRIDLEHNEIDFRLVDE